MQPLSEQEPIGLLIAVARRRMKQASGTVARRFGLPPQQFWILLLVLEIDGLSLRELADRLRIDTPTASRVVAGLVRRGLVRMEAHATDRRRARIVATDKGRVLEPGLRAVAAKVRAAAVEGLTPGEQRALRSGLRRVIANMERFDRRNGRAHARVSAEEEE